LLVRAYIRTHGFPAVIVRPSNNYGPWQYPEKFIPRAVLNLLMRKKIPVYASGKNVREWLYVSDCAAGILAALKRGRTGEVYNLGSKQEKRNIDVAHSILKTVGRKADMIEFVKDRPGHDFRYRLNSNKAGKVLKWKPKMRFEDGIKLTVNWCLANKNWLLSKWDNISRLYS
jgi:dTDP-glucose 4,6-dehydratase